jgi:hypothetical protein
MGMVLNTVLVAATAIALMAGEFLRHTARVSLALKTFPTSRGGHSWAAPRPPAR